MKTTETSTEGKQPAPPAIDEREVVITRTLDAPRQRVFEAWTDPKKLKGWFGPKGFTTPEAEIEARPGGALRIVMRSPEGRNYPIRGVIRELVPPARLVYTEYLDEHPRDWQEQLQKLREKHAPGKPGTTSQVMVTFEERGGKTEMTVRTRFDSRADRDAMEEMGMTQGWNECFDRLEEMLAKA